MKRGYLLWTCFFLCGIGTFVGVCDFAGTDDAVGACGLAQFNGSVIAADNVIYILDTSGSVGWGSPNPLQVAKDMTNASLQSLSSPTHFSIIDATPLLTWSTTPMIANPANIAAGIAFVNSMASGGNSCLDTAVLASFSIAANGTGSTAAIFISDGLITCAPDIAAIQAANTDGIPVHCFTMLPATQTANFESYATATGGVFSNGGTASWFRRGDVNGDSTINVLDVILMLEYMIFAAPSVCCPHAADINGSGTVALNDAILLMDYLFTGGPPPAAPFPGCGPGTQSSSLPPCLSSCP